MHVDGTRTWDRQRERWRADVMVNGQRRRKRFPSATPEGVIAAWIAEQLRDRDVLVLPRVDTLSLWNERWVAFTEGRRLSPVATGISWTIHGWRVQVMRNCHLAVKSFPRNSPLQTMQAWREQFRRELVDKIADASNSI